MLLRPATPLSVILFIAFALLLLSTLSTPIIKAIPLSVDEGWEFGVFGYCSTAGTNCIKPHIGYSTDQLFTSGDSGDFSLPSGQRNSLSYILIIHPIAALLTLICTILALAAHFHAPSASARYLLALLILTIPTILASLLAFLVDILLFVPHLAWGGWIVLAATILIIASSVLTCAMRRTLISRKAQSKRIAENEDMNGTSYYNALNERRTLAEQNPGRPPSPPTTTAYNDKSDPQFATFDVKSHDGTSRTSEDRAPLNPSSREGSMRSRTPGGRPYDQRDQYPPLPGSTYENRAMTPGGSNSPHDEYGNGPISPISPNEMGGAMMRPSESRGSNGSNSAMSMRGAPYGRARGYGPPQRGYGAPRGAYGPPGRGYGPPRGGYGPRGGYRGGPPPPGYNGRGGYATGPRRDPSPGYTLDPYYSSRDSPSRHDNGAVDNQFIARGASPDAGMGIGQAIEMDERTGSPPNMSYGQQGHVDSIAERAGSTSPVRSGYSGRPDAGPMYSDAAYVPPRSDWKPMQAVNAPSRFTPDQQYSNTNRGLSPIQASPNSDTLAGAAHHVRAGSENYYEDVDPRFAGESSNIDHHVSSNVPTALMPGSSYGNPSSGRMQAPFPDKTLLQPPPRQFKSSSDRSNSGSSIENEPMDHPVPISGARSPDGSEASHFTSISQRPVNPHWRPGYSGGGQGSSAVAAQRRKEDIILNGNPDFAIPGVSSSSRRARGGSASNIATGGLTPQGRYPTEL